MKNKIFKKLTCFMLSVAYSFNLIYANETILSTELKNQHQNQPLQIDINSYKTLLEMQCTPENTIPSNGLPIDFFTEAQKKIQIEYYTKSLEKAELEVARFKSMEEKGENGIDIAKLMTQVAIGLGNIPGWQGKVFKASALFATGYGFDKVKNEFKDFISKFKNDSEQKAAELLFQPGNIKIDEFYEKYKNNPDLMSNKMPELESIIESTISKNQSEKKPKNITQQKTNENLKLKTREIALSVIELKSKIEKNQIKIEELEKNIKMSIGSNKPRKVNFDLQRKFQELDTKLLESANIFQDLQFSNLEKLSFISKKLNNLTKKIEASKNNNHLPEKALIEEYIAFADLKKDLELASTISAGNFSNNKKFQDLFSEASKGNLSLKDIEDAKKEKENLKKLNETLDGLAGAINIASEITTLAIQNNAMSRSTAIQVQGTLKIASGIHQVLQNSALTLSASVISGGILGAISIVGGLFSLFGSHKDSNDQLGIAFKNLFENQEKIMSEVQNLKHLSLKLHIQTHDYMHSEFNHIKDSLNLIKSDTNYLVDKTTFENCDHFKNVIEKTNSSSIEGKLKAIDFLDWRYYVQCSNELSRLLTATRYKKYPLEDIARPQKKQSTSDSRENEESNERRNDNLFYLLNFATETSRKITQDNEQKTLQKMLGLMSFDKYNYTSLKLKVDKLKDNSPEAIKVSEEMFSFIKNAKINPNLLQRITEDVEMLAPWAIGIKATSDSFYFLNKKQLNELTLRIAENKENSEEFTPYVNRLKDIASNLKDVTDAAMIQQNILDGDILLPFAWDIIEDDQVTIYNNKINTPGNLSELAHKEEFKNIRKTILKNPTFLNNTIRWGLYKAFNNLSKEQKRTTLQNYDLFTKKQDSNSMRDLLSTIFANNDQSQLNWASNTEIQIYNDRELDLVNQLQFYTNKLSEISKKLNSNSKDKTQTTEELRDSENKKTCQEKIEDIKNKLNKRAQGLDIQEKNTSALKSSALYIKIPGISDIVKLPQTDDLRQGHFIQTNHLYTEPHTQATLLDFSYKAAAKVK